MLQQVLDYIGGNYIGSLFFLAYTTLLPILVTEVAGPAANAHFYLPWTIISSLQLVSVNMTMSLTVEASRRQEKMEVYGRRVWLHVLKILGPIVLTILLGAPYFMRIFGKEYTVEGATLLRILALSLVPHLLISLAISLARVKNPWLQYIDHPGIAMHPGPWVELSIAAHSWHQWSRDCIADFLHNRS